METQHAVILLVLCTVLGVSCKRPNIVFILTDDQDVLMGGETPMVNTLNMIGKQGMTFKNMFTSSPLCCPSRSSIFTGNYVHNHNAVNNSIDGNCSSTAWQNGPEKNTFATHLHDLGYRTFFAGKYLNQYGDKAVGGVAHIPPGWDEWHGLVHNSVYYNYTLSVNGKAEVHGDNYTTDYLTDIINNRSHEFLARQNIFTPFFVMVSTPACHSPFDSAPQYMKEFADKKAPRDPSFNKAGKDKHWLIRHAPNPLSDASLTYIDDTFRKRWRTLLSVDDMVKNIVTTLDKLKLLDSTFIIFSSDNGFHLGQFSLPNDKRQLYDFDIRVPLMIRGPGIPANSNNIDPVLNIDIMPTIIQLAGETPPSSVDGMSLVPLLKNKGTAAWRTEVLIEHKGTYNVKGVGRCKHTEYLSKNKGTAAWRSEVLIEHEGEFKVKGVGGCKHTEYLDMPNVSTPEKWRTDVLIEHDGEYAPKGYTGCKHTEYLNLPKGVGSKAQTPLGSAALWRESILVEHQGEYRRYGDYGCKNADYLCTCYPNCVCEDGFNNTYSCRRVISKSANTMYCEFSDDENFQEFYNFTSDPHQLTNIIKKMSPEFLAEQNKQLVKLSVCQGASCKEVHPPEDLQQNTLSEGHSSTSNSNIGKNVQKNSILETKTVINV